MRIAHQRCLHTPCTRSRPKKQAQPPTQSSASASHLVQPSDNDRNSAVHIAAGLKARKLPKMVSDEEISGYSYIHPPHPNATPTGSNYCLLATFYCLPCETIASNGPKSP